MSFHCATQCTVFKAVDFGTVSIVFIPCLIAMHQLRHEHVINNRNVGRERSHSPKAHLKPRQRGLAATHIKLGTHEMSPVHTELVPNSGLGHLFGLMCPIRFDADAFIERDSSFRGVSLVGCHGL